MGKKLGYDLFIEKANEKHNNKYKYPKFNYIDTSQFIDIECPQHGLFSQKISAHLSGFGCTHCRSSTTEEFIEKANKLYNNKYLYDKTIYYNNTKEIIVTCPEHGDFTTKPAYHLYEFGCPICSKIKYNDISLKKFKEKCTIIHDGKYNYDKSEYEGNTFKTTIICPEHGEFKQSIAQHLKGSGCPRCAIQAQSYSSSYEKEIIEYLKEYLSEDEIYPSYRVKKEIDIYLPNYKIGIEFNGVYWHSHLLKESTYHKEKSDYFKELDINIFHVWEYQWTNPIKKEIIKSMILNKICKIPNKIFARKCVIKELSSSDYKEFCNYNHIQGHSPAQIKIGLYYNNELVSCMSFGKLRMNLGNKVKQEGEWELVRFCNKLNTSVVGGASKLLNYFEKTYLPIKLISYADNDYSQGNLYNVLGFSDKGITNISYSYYNPKEDSIKK